MDKTNLVELFIETLVETLVEAPVEKSSQSTAGPGCRAGSKAPITAKDLASLRRRVAGLV